MNLPAKLLIIAVLAGGVSSATTDFKPQSKPLLLSAIPFPSGDTQRRTVYRHTYPDTRMRAPTRTVPDDAARPSPVYQQIYTIDGTKFGRMGALSYMLSDKLERLSPGFHTFKKLPDGNWFATLGTMPAIVSPTGKVITETYLRDLAEKKKRISI